VSTARFLSGGRFFQGPGLYDSRVSLIQYSRDLFKHVFADVKFPSRFWAPSEIRNFGYYAGIFPNVIPERALWVTATTPSTIAHDLAARLSGAQSR